MVTHCRLASWNDVNMLAHYPSLRALRLSQIPLFVGRGSSEVRPEVIARIKQLVFFNGSQVSPRERTEAEKNYCRMVLFAEVSRQQQAGGEAPPPSVFASNPAAASVDRALHPRFDELMALYAADLTPPTRTVGGPANLAAELVSVTLRNLSFGSNGSLEPVTKKLPRSLQVCKLQLMVKQLFGLEPRLQHLSMRVHKDAPPTLLEDDTSTLQYYGVVDGAEVFINEAKDA
jgi:hypothetical protein